MTQPEFSDLKESVYEWLSARTDIMRSSEAAGGSELLKFVYGTDGPSTEGPVSLPTLKGARYQRQSLGVEISAWGWVDGSWIFDLWEDTPDEYHQYQLERLGIHDLSTTFAIRLTGQAIKFSGT